MKEITRIHIAKTAYDIELTAKKELEQYIAALEQYANDSSILEDIEIRITELLQENGTTKDNVITTSDVTAVRQRLGEPQDFAEDSEVVALPVDTAAKPHRRLYRDQDKALLGGVLSGMAIYFGINPVWTRLIFLALLIQSFGTMIILYVVLWIVLPPARTAAEKLELEGKHITLAAIKERSERLTESINANQTSKTVQKALLFCLGLFFSVATVGSLIATIAGSVLVFGTGSVTDLAQASQTIEPVWLFWLGYGMLVLSGLLFAALNAVLAIATFTRNWTKRIGIAVIAIVLSGIVAFSGGIGSMMYGGWQAQESIRQSMTTSDHKLTAKFGETKKLIVDASQISSIGSPSVLYIVSSEAPHAELSYPENSAPKFDVTQKGSESKITISASGDKRGWYEPTITIYGPALDELTVRGGSVKYTADQPQNSMTLIASDASTLNLEGRFETITARTQGGPSIDLENASVRNLNAITMGGNIEAGIVGALSVTQPDACPSSTVGDENIVQAEGVSSAKVKYNGTMKTIVDVQAMKTPCGSVVVGDNDEWED